MNGEPNRQRAHGALAASADESDIRGLLHDLGHQLMTVSLLAESVQAAIPEDHQAAADARNQAAVMVQETGRAVAMIASAVPPADLDPLPGTGQPQLIDVRELAAAATRLGQLRHEANVGLQPGPATFLMVDPMLVWRVVGNLMDNAARAAGPDGNVNIRISRDAGTVVEITDDGEGFGRGPGGMAGRGLSVVAQLLAATGGELEVRPGQCGGTSARAIFGGRCDRIVLPRQRDGRVMIG